MKKKVNGKIIDIDNLELLEASFRGITLNAKSHSLTDVVVCNDKDRDIVKKYIDIYNEAHSTLPTVLRNIEDNVKYSALATILKHRLQEKEEEVVTEPQEQETEPQDKETQPQDQETQPQDQETEDNQETQPNETTNPEMWINKGLFIRIEPITALRFYGNTWAIVRVPDEVRQDNTDIDLYKNKVGYKEFMWAIEKWTNPEYDSPSKEMENFYIDFMPDFTSACNNDDILLYWELGRILDFGAVPKQQRIIENTILDVNKNIEYILDIFQAGTMPTNKEEIVFVTGDGKPRMEIKKKEEPIYDYSIYKKDLEKMTKLEPVVLGGFTGIYEVLIANSLYYDTLDFKFKGIILGNRMVFQTSDEIYTCTVNSYTEPVLVAKGADIYSYTSKYVYLVKKHYDKDGIVKNMIYALNPVNMQIKLCKICFEKINEL